MPLKEHLVISQCHLGLPIIPLVVRDALEGITREANHASAAAAAAAAAADLSESVGRWNDYRAPGNDTLSPLFAVSC